MGDIVAFTPERVLDANGDPVSGAQARFYLSGTSTPAVVYSDSAETVPHPTPILSNAAGIFPAAYRSGVALKVDVVNAIGGAVPGYPIDPVRVTGVNSTRAAGISFAATPDIPATDVQTAIVLVQASVLAPISNVGLGIDGLAPELADFNATNIKAGHYRFTATTAGSRPVGWIAGNVGTVSVYRHDSANAVMIAVKTATNETAQRVLTAGVWGAWGKPYMTTNILASVSQASGVPTGGLIERGSNANGEYVKFADGTMICTSPTYTHDATTSVGSVFTSGAQTWTFPASFISGTNCTGGGAPNDQTSWISFTPGPTASAGTYAIFRATSGAARSARLFAIGRWF